MGLLYTHMKIFHFKDKLDSLPRETPEILPPVHIRIKPTNICGHNCSYCAYRNDSLQLGKDMGLGDTIPRVKMLEIIDEVAEMGVGAVTFSGGGDPLYYPHMAETVRRLVATPVKFAALTNGARLEGEVAEIFAAHGTWIRVSIDGWDDSSYSEYRRVAEGEFGRVLENMAGFRRLDGKCRLGASIIVDRKNAPHLHELTRRLKDVGVNSVKISPCIISNDVFENNEYHRPLMDGVKEQIARLVDDLSGEDFEIHDSFHLGDAKFKKDYTWCPYLQILPVIGADLNVYSCQDKAYNRDCGLLGSIREVGLRQFWMSDKEKFFRIDPSLHCGHHCVAGAKNRMVLEYLHTDGEHLPFV